ncbi:MAG: alkylation response protein AidB-like acyl-CoA dehydrogenase [Candidatus Azotimanducaceae bacterium]|jgi:alkylation response protein AidB-like acyl-CoA dehydrogenase
MDFSLSDEQVLLQDSVQRFIQNDYGFDIRQKILESDEGFSRKIWQSFADLGWLALPFGEADGGIGGGAVELMILLEAFGKGLVVEPYLSTVVLAGRCLEWGGSSQQKESMLAELIEGKCLGALAFVEPQARFNLSDVMTTATQEGDSYVLNGFKGVVLGGPTADFVVVPARTSGAQDDDHGISLFVVSTDAAGVTRRNYATVDGGRAAEFTFTDVKLADSAMLGVKDEGLALLQRVIDHAILAIGAEAVGAMEVAYKLTVEYCKTREQFGQPIGKFQVLQHRMVDMFMEHEQSKSLLYMAAMRLDEGYDQAARKAVSALKVQIGKSGRFVGENAIQLHGGMGMTEEMSIGHYFKRLTIIDTLFGNADYHLRKYARVA